MRVEVKSKTWLEADGKFIIGEHGIALLEAIDELGSIQQAAKQLGWGYRHTWGYLKNMERNAGVPILLVRHGGQSGGGTQLTPQGRKLLRDYKRLQKTLRATIQRKSRLLFSY
ncbi:winged helix-turn-helix domain-containing protein [Candidatus Methylomirabilis sp.]|uniref:winged helix-turn-helix domain-containing protein n=1 Tax=Candidatus Methylomirabilis sp. TaxID=2032687 RepID=UPI002A62F033|nr:winged helix-turn-helix domain-containing protein [Candidatus Methylomirabilis sp.]